jgi:hypothetical protein
LDEIWEKYMSEGKFVTVNVYESRTAASEESSTPNIDPMEEEVSHGYLSRNRLVVQQLGEGLFGRGGWLLLGGLLRRFNDGPGTIELYVKAVTRIFPHVPFPPHREGPSELGFEFFLLHRKPGSPGVVIRKWIFQPDEIKLDKFNSPELRCVLLYDKTSKTATVTIFGLTRSFQDRVDLFAIVGGMKP